MDRQAKKKEQERKLEEKRQAAAAKKKRIEEEKKRLAAEKLAAEGKAKEAAKAASGGAGTAGGSKEETGRSAKEASAAGGETKSSIAPGNGRPSAGPTEAKSSEPGKPKPESKRDGVGAAEGVRQPEPKTVAVPSVGGDAGGAEPGGHRATPPVQEASTDARVAVSPSGDEAVSGGARDGDHSGSTKTAETGTEDAGAPHAAPKDASDAPVSGSGGVDPDTTKGGTEPGSAVDSASQDATGDQKSTSPASVEAQPGAGLEGSEGEGVGGASISCAPRVSDAPPSAEELKPKSLSEDLPGSGGEELGAGDATGLSKEGSGAPATGEGERAEGAAADADAGREDVVASIPEGRDVTGDAKPGDEGRETVPREEGGDSGDAQHEGEGVERVGGETVVGDGACDASGGDVAEDGEGSRQEAPPAAADGTADIDAHTSGATVAEDVDGGESAADADVGVSSAVQKESSDDAAEGIEPGSSGVEGSDASDGGPAAGTTAPSLACSTQVVEDDPGAESSADAVVGSPSTPEEKSGEEAVEGIEAEPPREDGLVADEASREPCGTAEGLAGEEGEAAPGSGERDKGDGGVVITDEGGSKAAETVDTSSSSLEVDEAHETEGVEEAQGEVLVEVEGLSEAEAKGEESLEKEEKDEGGKGGGGGMVDGEPASSGDAPRSDGDDEAPGGSEDREEREESREGDNEQDSDEDTSFVRTRHLVRASVGSDLRRRRHDSAGPGGQQRNATGTSAGGEGSVREGRGDSAGSDDSSSDSDEDAPPPPLVRRGALSNLRVDEILGEGSGSRDAPLSSPSSLEGEAVSCTREGIGAADVMTSLRSPIQPLGKSWTRDTRHGKRGRLVRVPDSEGRAAAGHRGGSQSRAKGGGEGGGGGDDGGDQADDDCYITPEDDNPHSRSNGAKAQQPALPGPDDRRAARRLTLSMSRDRGEGDEEMPDGGSSESGDTGESDSSLASSSSPVPPAEGSANIAVEQERRGIDATLGAGVEAVREAPPSEDVVPSSFGSVAAEAGVSDSGDDADGPPGRQSRRRRRSHRAHAELRPTESGEENVDFEPRAGGTSLGSGGGGGVDEDDNDDDDEAGLSDAVGDPLRDRGRGGEAGGERPPSRDRSVLERYLGKEGENVSGETSMTEAASVPDDADASAHEGHEGREAAGAKSQEESGRAGTNRPLYPREGAITSQPLGDAP